MTWNHRDSKLLLTDNCAKLRWFRGLSESEISRRKWVVSSGSWVNFAWAFGPFLR